MDHSRIIVRVEKTRWILAAWMLGCKLEPIVCCILGLQCIGGLMSGLVLIRKVHLVHLISVIHNTYIFKIDTFCFLLFSMQMRKWPARQSHSTNTNNMLLAVQLSNMVCIYERFLCGNEANMEPSAPILENTNSQKKILSTTLASTCHSRE